MWVWCVVCILRVSVVICAQRQKMLKHSLVHLLYDIAVPSTEVSGGEGDGDGDGDDDDDDDDDDVRHAKHASKPHCLLVPRCHEGRRKEGRKAADYCIAPRSRVPRSVVGRARLPWACIPFFFFSFFTAGIVRLG